MKSPEWIAASHTDPVEQICEAGHQEAETLDTAHCLYAEDLSIERADCAVEEGSPNREHHHRHQLGIKAGDQLQDVVDDTNQGCHLNSPHGAKPAHA